MDFEAEIKQYGNAILKYCYGILCDYHEAQDAMQEAFAKAYINRESLKSDESYKAWLYKIAYNTCVGMLRKRRFLLFWERKDVAKEPSYHMDEPFIDTALTQALQILSPTDRAIFYSRAVDDLSYSQMEELYNMKAAALRKRFERARNKLKII